MPVPYSKLDIIGNTTIPWRTKRQHLKEDSTFSFPQSIRTMVLTRSLFSTFVTLLVFGSISAQSDCNGCCGAGNYTELDEPRRSIKSIWELDQVALCDRDLSWGWYRFTSFVGGEMPTSVVSPKHCGTSAPVWIQGTHPTTQIGTVIRKACINFFDINKGCADSFNIKIRNCGTFYVYFLRPTYTCAVAYCAGKTTIIVITCNFFQLV